VALGKYKDSFARQNDNGLGNLAVYQRDRDLYMGWCGVCYSKFLDHIELGYRYCSDSWCKGYATEAAWAILTTIYKNTDIDEILGCTHPENTASIGVLEKLGFNYSYPKLSKPIGKDILVYKLDRKTFMRAHHT
jgi:RimJ/RimL family protein N-acetyltransferase